MEQESWASGLQLRAKGVGLSAHLGMPAANGYWQMATTSLVSCP